LTGTAIASVMVGLISAFAQIFVDVSVAQVLLLVFVVLFLQVRPQGVIAIKSRALDG
jgi:urea transport system permease protein